MQENAIPKGPEVRDDTFRKQGVKVLVIVVNCSGNVVHVDTNNVK